MRFLRGLFIAVALAACSPPIGTDAGQGGGASGGSAGGGGFGGGSGGGSTFSFACRDGGVVTDAGLDQSALLGTPCAPADLNALIQVCRVEPVDYFLASCPGSQLAPAGRFVELLNNSGIYSCAVFGADVMACVAPRVQECVNPDGGRPLDSAAGVIVGQCTTPRYRQSCRDACDAAHAPCFTACRTCGFESCALCSFECGRQFVACLRGCPPP